MEWPAPCRLSSPDPPSCPNSQFCPKTQLEKLLYNDKERCQLNQVIVFISQTYQTVSYPEIYRGREKNKHAPLASHMTKINSHSVLPFLNWVLSFLSVIFVIRIIQFINDLCRILKVKQYILNLMGLQFSSRKMYWVYKCTSLLYTFTIIFVHYTCILFLYITHIILFLFIIHILSI